MISSVTIIIITIRRLSILVSKQLHLALILQKISFMVCCH